MNTLFSPITLGELKLANRIVIPPMDQYSADEGRPTHWHHMHYGHLAVSGAGLLIVEATAVEPEGRISPQDLGLWSDEHEDLHRRMLETISTFSSIPIALQIGHAGRKGSTSRPWEGRGPLGQQDGGWSVCAPSALPFDAASPMPTALATADIDRLTASFVTTAQRAMRAGYKAIELHAAHGYLMHEFLSPLSNKREDEYGGSLENRMRFPLRVFAAVRKALPDSIPVGMRVSGTDFAPGGWDVAECAILAQELEKAGAAFIHVSGGGLSPDQQINLAPGYQVYLAQTIKQAVTSLPVIAVGLITEPELASGIIVSGQADMVAVGRAILYDPRWPWHAAATLGASIADAPKQYLRCQPHKLKSLFV
ncbi:NADH:flavin oxidoreductase/NADH oxidase [Desulfovibrio intestinalis]|uniref:2,4-dienoyl-CoA reductase-like NADH-dependent reductase (Old Yellow Enzyme family) n=1 Tax=Desulfovibrio intestinalis TaxID=58621 RepID=A0A7W8C2K2_9BACT|nr:NADH:flavin oxidoreductase/NADH oxidase [Desulfovibrio intestinalis]MBB5142545.1 2,4-dienoyl-CoA reductase-like NADH-dependent reductase (Old Yellow Enzyme family) [Desulfovibrio intestinalis]